MAELIRVNRHNAIISLKKQEAVNMITLLLSQITECDTPNKGNANPRIRIGSPHGDLNQISFMVDVFD